MLRIKIKASDQKINLDRIYITVNNVPIYGKSGINIRDKNIQNWEEDISVQLSRGKNKITLSVLNIGGAESLLETIIITYDAPPTKPNLYLIGLGVNDFIGSELDLSYPIKDIQDIVDLYQNQTDLYHHIFIDTLFDQSISIAKIKNLKTKLQQSKVDDHILFFVAGHGILDINFNYYFATPNTNFDKPSINSIPYEELENLLDEIPARYKLFLMDACHSGEIDKDNISLENKLDSPLKEQVKFRSTGNRPVHKQVGLYNSFELMKELFVDLRRGTGASIISSASGVEFAWEGDQWKNSVFTYALLSGLKEKKADLNNDGAIMISELQKYLAMQVSKLTNNQQQPTMRIENISNDWRVW